MRFFRLHSHGVPRRVGFVVSGEGLFGAQKRFISLAHELTKYEQPCVVFVPDVRAVEFCGDEEASTSSIVTYRYPWWVTIWNRGRVRFPTIWRCSPIRACRSIALSIYWRRQFRDCNIAIAHVALTLDPLAYTGCPIVFEVTSPDWADKLNADIRQIPRRVTLNCVSESVRKRLGNGFKKHNVWCAPLPFLNVDPESTCAPNNHAKENRIVFAHRLVSRKNGVLFARVTRDFLTRHPEWSVCLFGRGPDETRIVNILHDEIANGDVEVGYCKNLPSELRRSRVFVSLIEDDNYPSQSVLEAMANGNAVLLSNRGWTREKLFGGNGMLTDINFENILSALEQLVADPNELNVMGLLSYELVRKCYRRRDYIAYLLRLYNTLLVSENQDELRTSLQ